MLIVETIMAVFIGATLVSGLLFFTTSLVPGGSVGHGGWILSALIACMGMSLALLLLIQHKPEPASLVLKVTGIGWSTAFYQGTLLFLRVLQHRIFLYTLAIVTAGLIIYLQQVLDAGFQAALVFSLYCATINFILAWFIFRADHTDCENCRRLSRVLAAILILHGLHLLHHAHHVAHRLPLSLDHVRACLNDQPAST